ncbi:hypothetical protein [Flavobacterium sp.]
MSRKNSANIKKYNDKLHKAKAKDVQAALDRKAQLKEIMRKYNSEQTK